MPQEHFAEYPPEARQVAADHFDLLRTLPVAFLELLLQQVKEFDWRFPAEREDITQQLAFLTALSIPERRQLLAGFEALRLPHNLSVINWSRSPTEYSEQLSAHLWGTHQIDAFRRASAYYLETFSRTKPPAPLATPRLGIAIIGKNVETTNYRLFRKLRAHGTYFTHVDPTKGLIYLLEAVTARAAAHPLPFAHWYLDGGNAETTSLLTLSYSGIEPMRRALLRKMDSAIKNGITGPEAMLTLMHRLDPTEIGFPADPQNAVLNHFQTSLLISGAGTQIFSTSYVQWATRELWRRAQPLTILARFAPRQRQRAMNEMLSGDAAHAQLDPEGSLIDADMAAFYMWADQQRLPGADQAGFLVWFENHHEAMLIAPGLPRNTESNDPVTIPWLLKQVQL